jgi:hypothetical protein
VVAVDGGTKVAGGFEMTSVIVLYLMLGLLSYWPTLYFWKSYDESEGIRWYHWGMAWAAWCVCWPARVAQDAWYWWRAKK